VIRRFTEGRNCLAVVRGPIELVDNVMAKSLNGSLYASRGGVALDTGNEGTKIVVSVPNGGALLRGILASKPSPSFLDELRNSFHDA
jgi:hypothetical protein